MRASADPSAATPTPTAARPGSCGPNDGAIANHSPNDGTGTNHSPDDGANYSANSGSDSGASPRTESRTADDVVQ